MDKEPQRRWQSAQEIHDELDRLRSSLADSPVPLRQVGFLSLVILCSLLILAFFASRSRLAPAAAAVDPGQSFRFEVQPDAGWRFTTADATLGAPEFALSPSGRELAYVAASDNDGRHLWLQYLAEERATRLPGTERASLPFWSADGASIAFVVDSKLKAVSLNGGSVRTIGEVGWDFRSGDWTSDRQIPFCRSTGGLFRIPETGGDPTPLTHIGSANAQTLHRWPFVLPDRQHFLYLSRSSDPGSRGIFAGSLNDPALTKFVMPSRHSAVYANGYLLFLQESRLVAIQFDMALMSVSGRAAVVAENVHGSTNTRAAVSVSQAGVMAYASAMLNRSRPVWFRRDGGEEPPFDPVADYIDVRLGPNGRRAAFTRQAADSGSPDIWTHDFDRGVISRLIASPELDTSPIWSADGRGIYFRSDRTGVDQIWRADVTDPSQPSVVLSEHVSNGILGDVSRDGKWLVYSAPAETSSHDIWKVRLEGGTGAVRYVSTSASEVQPAISPDGRFLAYASDETGTYEIFIETFPDAGNRWQVSSHGGTEPRWRGDGKELYYVSTDKQLTAVHIKLSSEVGASAPVPLFRVKTARASLYRRSYDVTRDGTRFLVLKAEDSTPAPSVHVLTNWTSRLAAQ
ncbi:MAG: PD40 domain-containing protein [Bryobacteraceae bacterium]|nr:PD40 domain-containing protein [Bryobacteraceae bacterium]